MQKCRLLHIVVGTLFNYYGFIAVPIGSRICVICDGFPHASALEANVIVFGVREPLKKVIAYSIVVVMFSEKI